MRHSETGGRAAGQVFRYFNEDLMRIYPNTKRYFDRPAGVYIETRKADSNATEEFTDTSAAPDVTQEQVPVTEEKLVF
jgi:hypothetical protein